MTFKSKRTLKNIGGDEFILYFTFSWMNRALTAESRDSLTFRSLRLQNCVY